MNDDLNFVKIVCYDGVHYIRKHLIKSVSEYRTNMYCLSKDEPIDVRSKLYYDTGDIFYFTEDVDTVIESLKGEW